jgi:hypothetical protein
MRAKIIGARFMRKQISSRGREAQQCTPRRIGWMILSASLVTGIALLQPDPAFAQASVSPNMQPSLGVGATSPFNSGSGQRAGIPLGSTEIATPGIAPVIPSPNMGAGACTDLGNARSSSALFDGGGLSGSSSLSCAGSGNASPSASSPSAGRVGIPLGATELGNAGASPLSAVPGPNQSGSTIAAPADSTQPNTNASLPGAGP